MGIMEVGESGHENLQHGIANISYASKMDPIITVGLYCSTAEKRNKYKLKVQG